MSILFSENIFNRQLLLRHIFACYAGRKFESEFSESLGVEVNSTCCIEADRDLGDVGAVEDRDSLFRSLLAEGEVVDAKGQSAALGDHVGFTAQSDDTVFSGNYVNGTHRGSDIVVGRDVDRVNFTDEGMHRVIDHCLIGDRNDLCLDTEGCADFMHLVCLDLRVYFTGSVDDTERLDIRLNGKQEVQLGIHRAVVAHTGKQSAGSVIRLNETGTHEIRDRCCQDRSMIIDADELKQAADDVTKLIKEW